MIHAPAMCQAQIQKLEEGLSSTLVLCWGGLGLGLGQVFFHWFQEVLCSIPIYFTFAYFGQPVAPDLFVAVLKQVQEVFVSKYSVFEVYVESYMSEHNGLVLFMIK